jgi:hypothetical protein
MDDAQRETLMAAMQHLALSLVPAPEAEEPTP